MNRLLFDHDRVVADWTGKKLDTEFDKILAAFGKLNESGELIAGIVLHDPTRFDVELSYWGVGSFTPSMVKALAYIVFIHAKLNRLTVRVPRKKNRGMRPALMRFGFSHEGVQRRYYNPYKTGDAILYGIVRDDAERYIRRFNEQRSEAA